MDEKGTSLPTSPPREPLAPVQPQENTEQTQTRDILQDSQPGLPTTAQGPPPGELVRPAQPGGSWYRGGPGQRRRGDKLRKFTDKDRHGENVGNQSPGHVGWGSHSGQSDASSKG